MNKLLSAEFVRLFKSRLFKICLFISGICGAVPIVSRWIDIKRFPDIYEGLADEYKQADSLLFMGTILVVFVIAAFAGLFVGTEYSDGTIRNKLIVGHKRSNVYISKLIVCVLAGIIMQLVCIFAAWVICIFAAWVTGMFEITLGFWQITGSIMMVCVAVTALMALLLLISMSIQSKSIGSVACLIFLMTLFCVNLTIMQKLSATEYYDSYAYIDDETGELIEVQEQKNPFYVSGLERDIYEFLFDFSPIGQMMQIMILENVRLIMLYDLAILIVATQAGIIILKRKNLK